jgi:hypothetical protein
VFRQLSTWVAVFVAVICIGLGGLATHTLMYNIGKTSTTPVYCGSRVMQPGETCEVTGGGYTESHDYATHTEKQGKTGPIFGVVISVSVFIICVVFLYKRWKSQPRS